VRGRRSGLRYARAELSEAHRSTSEERSQLSRRAIEVAGQLATARAEAARAAEEVARAEAAAEGSAEEIRAEWGSTLEAARAEAEKHPENTEAERQTLARRLKRFGDVNLLALSQEEHLRERHEFVAAQRADAEEAAAELDRIIQSVDREIEVRFSETFGRVRGAFGEIVPKMLVGASGVLDLSEEGVEVGIRLGRKGWRSLRVLSGGERALLALSFLFSIFLSRPTGGSGAFCILDEAEAALDDVNLARFLSVVDSHRSGGQYLLVTHQKRTMAAADVLYGVVRTPPVPALSYRNVCREKKKSPMARSWRNFFRRSPDEPQDQAPTATETEVPAKEEESGNGADAAVGQPAESGPAEPAGTSIEDVEAVGSLPVEETEVRLEEVAEPACFGARPVEPPVEEVLESEPVEEDLPEPTPSKWRRARRPRPMSRRRPVGSGVCGGGSRGAGSLSSGSSTPPWPSSRTPTTRSSGRGSRRSGLLRRRGADHREARRRARAGGVAAEHHQRRGAEEADGRARDAHARGSGRAGHLAQADRDPDGRR
jgi:hypothetical protein